MTTFRRELKRIVGRQHPDAEYVGDICFIPVGDDYRAKLQFVTCGSNNRYEALQLTLLNQLEGAVGTALFRFTDLFGCSDVRMKPFIWHYGDQTQWYNFRPNQIDYEILGKTVDAYLFCQMNSSAPQC